jgi:hypothetical protein
MPTEDIIIDKFSGINFSFENEKFFVEIDPCSRPVKDLRTEFKIRAAELYQKNPKLMLGLSSGLDSQSVLHSFVEQGIDIDYSFLYFPGYNDQEYQNLKILEKKYDIKCIIVDIDPMACKDEVLSIYDETGIPPGQILQRMFLEKLPKDVDFIQGIHGPDVFFDEGSGQRFILESANSLEIYRLRAFLTLKNRTGKIIGWERTPEISLSLISDDVFRSYIFSYPYILKNNLIYRNGDGIPIIDHWDLYVKPFIYGKYWGGELEYFPKYQAPEKIDYVMNKPYHMYIKNLIKIPYQELLNHLKSENKITKRFYENYVPSEEKLKRYYDNFYRNP